MRYTKLILKNYKRFKLNQITEIDYQPLSPYQIITGNNGSGKTSLLDELSPLPTDKKKFSTKGYKEIHIEKSNHHYKLITDFTESASGKHYFFLDDVDLNDSNNVTMQRQLVEEHFGYTQEVHDILMGNIKLTDLSPNERRDWFVKIANTDMEFIMDAFSLIKTQARDGIGAIRNNEKRLNEEKATFDQISDVNEIKREEAELTSAVTAIEAILPNTFRQLSEVEVNLDDVTSRISALNAQCKEIDTIGDSYYQFGCSSTESLKMLDYDLSVKTDTIRSDYEALVENQQKAERELSTLQFDSNLTDTDLEITIKQAENEMRILSHFTELEGVTLTKDLREYQFLEKQLLEWVTVAVPNPDKKFTREAYDRCQETLKEKREMRTKMETRLEYAKEQIKHAEEHKANVVCPKCGHDFPYIKGEDQINRYRQFVEKATETLPSLINEITALEDYSREAIEYRNSRSQFRKLISGFSELTFFFESLTTKEAFEENPNSLTLTISQFFLKLQQHLRWCKSRDDYLKAKDVLEARRSPDTERLKGSIELLSSQADKKMQQLREIKETRGKVKEVLDNILRFESNANQLLTLAEEYDKLYEESISSIAYTQLSEKRMELLAKLAKVKERLHSIDIQSKVLEHLTQHIEELRLRDARYKRIIDLLNPNDGLIAKSLHGFIVHFLKQMNQIIGHIWSYDFNIIVDQDSDFTSKYRFPVNVGNNMESEDVSKTSLGQTDVINFAFMILVLRYLKLPSLPLLLDELGRTFTEEHRLKVFNYLKQLVETGQIEQLFLVSHNASSHESFSTADIVCFDINGVMQTEQVNRCIQFK